MTYDFSSLKYSLVENHNWYALVTINRSERLNALHPAAHHELEAVFDQLAQMPDLRCIILTGNGKAFCAGYDLHDNLETGILEIAAKGFAGMTGRTSYPVPVIAAVNGVAMGGGFELALACDIILASDEASFALPEARVGWSPLGGGLQRLPRAIGLKRTMGLVLTGRTVSAREGEQLGFVTQCVPADELMSTAVKIAHQIARCAPLAIRCNRQVATASMDMPLEDALDITNFDSVAPMLASEDAVEGKRAFVEKRAPNWKGA